MTEQFGIYFTDASGSLGLLDRDSGSSPAQRGVMAAANGYYAGDLEHAYLGPTAQAERVSNLERRVMTLEQRAAVNDKTIETLLAELATERSERQALADRVQRLELAQVALEGEL